MDWVTLSKVSSPSKARNGLADFQSFVSGAKTATKTSGEDKEAEGEDGDDHKEGDNDGEHDGDNDRTLVLVDPLSHECRLHENVDLLW